MNLTGRIRLKERQLEQAQRTLKRSTAEFREVLHRRLASRSALALGFAGGLFMGWVRGGRRRAPASRRLRAAAQHARRSLPPHWLGGYLVWPFVLATARDVLVSRRPSRREGEETSNPR